MHLQCFKRRGIPLISSAVLLPALLSSSLYAADTIVPAATGTTPPARVAPTPAVSPADYSTPKAAVKSFLNALRSADAAALRAAVDSPADQQDAVQTFLSTLAAGPALQKAAAAQFGSDGIKVFGNVSSPAVEARFKALDSTEAKITGDSATIVLPPDPATQTSGGTILLRNVGGKWKLDGPALFSLSSATPQQNAARLQVAKAMLVITDDITRDIKANKYLSAADAYQDYWTRARLAAGPGAATRPATSPAATSHPE